MKWIAVLLSLMAFLPGCAQSSGPQPKGEAVNGQSLSWIKFEDPKEGAFTLEVPRGWRVKGGLFRLGYSDERPMVDLTSPDSRINVRFGDVAAATYVLPNPYHPTEGSIYDLGAQARMVVARYRPGPAFAVLYSQARFQSACANPAADAGDVDLSVPDRNLTGITPDQTSAGEIAYHCGPDQKTVAFAYARTSLFGKIWQATVLASFIAPADQLATARAVLLKGVESFQLQAQWIERQKQRDAEGLEYQRMRQQQRMMALSQQVQQFESRMRAMRDQVSAFERQQHAQASQVQEFDNALVGVTPTRDPLTGTSRDVWTGTKSGYWSNGQGQVVNSDSPPPGGGWHQLEVTQPH